MGEMASDPPIKQATRRNGIINLKTAKSLVS